MYAVQNLWKHYRKRRSCSYRAICPFPTAFSTRLETILRFLLTIKLSSFSVEESKICRLGKGQCPGLFEKGWEIDSYHMLNPLVCLYKNNYGFAFMNIVDQDQTAQNVQSDLGSSLSVTMKFLYPSKTGLSVSLFVRVSVCVQNTSNFVSWTPTVLLQVY